MSTAPNPTYYFLNERQEPTGPVTLETIGALVSSGHLPASVFVARAGDAEWVPYSARSAASFAPVEAPADGLPPKPASNMLWAVAVSIACCLPLGVVAIIKAASVDGHYTAGRYSEAVKASRSAAKWCIWGGLLGMLVSVTLVMLEHWADSLP